jgi:glycosyltransferase involved in cell wall biosynthesis
MGSTPTISLIIPTIGRPSLARAIASVRLQRWLPGDEVIVVLDGPQPVTRELVGQFHLPIRLIEIVGPSNDWGHTPRNIAMPQATGTHLMALDDDDELTPDAVDRVRQALRAAPDQPHIFRMSGHPDVGTAWKVPTICEGNVGTPMFVCPNVPGKLGRYAPRYGGDFDFIRDTCGHYPDGPVWHEGVICRVRPFARATSGA